MFRFLRSLVARRRQAQAKATRRVFLESLEDRRLMAIDPLKFDFGTLSSPVELGYVSVRPGMLYPGYNGEYGWDNSGVSAGDAPVSGVTTDLNQDFNTGTAAQIFTAIVPAGTYDVAITTGHSANFVTDTQITVSGAATENVPNLSGSFYTFTKRVTVTDRIEITLDDAGASNDRWYLNAVTITPYSAAPVLTLGGQNTYNQGATSFIMNGGATVTDADSTDFDEGALTVTITNNADSGDVLEIKHQGTGATQISVSGNTVSYGPNVIGTISGGSGGVPLRVDLNSNATIAATQALIHRVAFKTTEAVPSTAQRTITYQLTDGDGGTSNAPTKLMSVNRWPSVGIDDRTIDEDGTTSFNFTIDDHEDAETALTVAATSDNTTLLPPGGIVLSGTGATRTMALTPAANQFGTATITVSVTDSQGAIRTDTFVLTVNPVNDRSVLNNTLSPTLDAIDEDDQNSAGTLVSSLLAGAVTDADPSALQGIAVVTATTTGVWEYQLTSGGAWTAFPVVSGTSALLLPSTARVRYLPPANFHGQAQLSYRAWDQTQGTIGGTADTLATNGLSYSAFSLAIEDAFLTVNPVNDLPHLNNSGSPALDSIGEDDTNSGGTTIASLVSGIVTDADAMDALGIAVFFDTGNGTWQYKLENGVWQDIGTVSSGSNLLLGPTARLRFAPNPNWTGMATIMFQAWDGTAGSEGNYISSPSTAFSNAFETATLTVDPVNDAPVLDNSTEVVFGTMNEDNTNPLGTLISRLLDPTAEYNLVADIDAGALQGVALVGSSGNGVWQFQLAGESTWTPMGTLSESMALLLAPNAKVRFVPAADWFGNAELTYRAWDQTFGGNGQAYSTQGAIGGIGAFSTNTETAALVVNSVNDAPGISSIGAVVVNNSQAFGPLAFTISDIDSNLAAVEVVPSVSNETLFPSGSIVIGGSGANRTITITPASGESGTALITLTASDGGASNNTTTLTFQITVNTPSPWFNTEWHEDVNGNGVVSNLDLQAIQEILGTATEVPVSGPPVNGWMADVNSDLVISQADIDLVQAALASAQSGSGYTIGIVSIEAIGPEEGQLRVGVEITGISPVSPGDEPVDVTVTPLAVRTGLGFATPGLDFVPTPIDITFYENGIQYVTIPINHDWDHEGIEVLEIKAEAHVSTPHLMATTLASIPDDDPEYKVSISVPDIGENSGSGVGTVRLYPAPRQGETVKVRVTNLNQTAIAGTDYAAFNELISFSANETAKPLTVYVYDNTTIDVPQKHFTVKARIESALPNNEAEDTVTLLDDDIPELGDGIVLGRVYATGTGDPESDTPTPYDILVVQEDLSAEEGEGHMALRFYTQPELAPEDSIGIRIKTRQAGVGEGMATQSNGGGPGDYVYTLDYSSLTEDDHVILVPLIDDSEKEPDERFLIDFEGFGYAPTFPGQDIWSGWSVESQFVNTLDATILAKPIPNYTLTVESAIGNEAEEAGSPRVIRPVVRISPIPTTEDGPVGIVVTSFDFDQTLDDSATAGDDYAQVSMSLTFNPGQGSHEIPVTLLDDDIPESEVERFGLKAKFVSGVRPTAIGMEFTGESYIVDNETLINVTVDSNDDNQIASPNDDIVEMRDPHVVFLGGLSQAVVQVQPGPESGPEERVFIRTNGSIRVWQDESKTIQVITDPTNPAVTSWPIDSVPSSLWIESLDPTGDASIEAVVRDVVEGSDIRSDEAKLSLANVDLVIDGISEEDEDTVAAWIALNAVREGTDQPFGIVDVPPAPGDEDLLEVLISDLLPAELDGNQMAYSASFEQAVVNVYVLNGSSLQRLEPGQVIQTLPSKLFVEGKSAGTASITFSALRNGTVVADFDSVNVKVLSLDILRSPQFVFGAVENYIPITFQVNGAPQVSVASNINVRAVDYVTNATLGSIDSNLFARDDGFGPTQGNGETNKYTVFVATPEFGPSLQIVNSRTINGAFVVRLEVTDTTGRSILLTSVAADTDARPLIIADANVMALDLQDPNAPSEVDVPFNLPPSPAPTLFMPSIEKMGFFSGDPATELTANQVISNAGFDEASVSISGGETSFGIGAHLSDAWDILNQYGDGTRVTAIRTRGFGAYWYTSYPGRTVPSLGGTVSTWLAMDLDYIAGDALAEGFEGGSFELATSTNGQTPNQTLYSGGAIAGNVAWALATMLVPPAGALPWASTLVGLAGAISSSIFGIAAGSLGGTNAQASGYLAVSHTTVSPNSASTIVPVFVSPQSNTLLADTRTTRVGWQHTVWFEVGVIASATSQFALGSTEATAWAGIVTDDASDWTHIDVMPVSASPIR